MVLGTSKRAITERAEEMGEEDDSIPLTVSHTSDPDESTDLDGSASAVQEGTPLLAPNLQAPRPTRDPDQVTGTGGPPTALRSNHDSRSMGRVQQDPLPLSQAQRWATQLTANLDIATYAALLAFIGLPVYYAGGYAMPVQLAFNIICFLLALRIPPKYKTYMHPVLVSSTLTILAIWVFALIHRSTLFDGLRAYSTGAKYTQIWDDEQGLQHPGAGDIFSSVLDVSIVALGLPMFQYRHELKSRFLTIALPNVSLSIGSLLAYPALCHAIGISGPRSLAFASRSLTLALATPATQNLGGDMFTVAPLCIFSGIVGVVVGPWALKTLKVPEGQWPLA